MIRELARVKVNLFLALNFMCNILPSISAWQRANVVSNCGINIFVPEKQRTDNASRELFWGKASPVL